MKFKLFVILCSISVASMSFAQEKTELEKFSAKTGVVSIMGYTDIGSILTDPSYSKQIVTLTYPHIGNTGVNTEDQESDLVAAAGLIIRNLPKLANNWRKEQDLGAYLQEKGVVAIPNANNNNIGSAAAAVSSAETSTLAPDKEKRCSISFFSGCGGFVLKNISCSGTKILVNLTGLPIVVLE